MMVASSEAGPEAHSAESRARFDVSVYETDFSISPDSRRLLMMPLVPAESSPTRVHFAQKFLTELRARVK